MIIKSVMQHCSDRYHSIQKLFPFLGTKQAAATAEKLAREKELAKVSIKNEDVDLIVQELEIPKSKAERTLREFQGNVVEAMASLTNQLILKNITMLILMRNKF